MREPAIYDALIGDKRAWDGPHYCRLATAAGGPVLELGVGTGRLAVSLLEAGVDLWGIDPNPTMLDYGRRKVARRFGDAPAERLLKGDAKTFALQRQFSLVIGCYNFLALVRPPDLEAVLERVAAHLLPGARFAFDIGVADVCHWGKPPYRWGKPKTVEVDGEPLAYEVEGRFDPDTRVQVLDERVELPSGRTLEERLELYHWRLDHLEAELTRLGWKQSSPPTDRDGNAYPPDGDMYCSVIERA